MGKGIEGIVFAVVGDGGTAVGDVEGAEVRAVPVKEEDDTPFVHVVAVLAEGTPGVEGIDAVVGNGKVAEAEEVVAGVSHRVPDGFACRSAVAEHGSRAGEVYFVDPREPLAVDVADVQAAVLHVGTGDARGSGIRHQAVAGIEHAFQAVGEVRVGTVRVGDAELVEAALRVADAITPVRVDAGGNDAVAGTHCPQRCFAVRREVGELRGIAGLAALLQVDFHEPAGAEIKGGNGVSLPVEGEVVKPFALAVASRHEAVYFAAAGVVDGKAVGALGGQNDKEGVGTDDFGGMDDVQVREVDAFRAAKCQGAGFGLQQRRGFRCDVRCCLAAGNAQCD